MLLLKAAVQAEPHSLQRITPRTALDPPKPEIRKLLRCLQPTWESQPSGEDKLHALEVQHRTSPSSCRADVLHAAPTRAARQGCVPTQFLSQGSKTVGWVGPKSHPDVELRETRSEQFNTNGLKVQTLSITFFYKITITVKPERISNIQKLISTTDLLGTKSWGLHFELKKLKSGQGKWLAQGQAGRRWQRQRRIPECPKTQPSWSTEVSVLNGATWELWAPTTPIDFRFLPEVRALGTCQVC